MPAGIVTLIVAESNPGKMHEGITPPLHTATGPVTCCPLVCKKKKTRKDQQGLA